MNPGAAHMPIGLELPQPAAPEVAVTLPSEKKSSRWLELLKWTFSFPAMLGTFLIGRVFYEGRAFFVDPDLWWHIKNGQNILMTHHWPTTDPYSFTVAGVPWLSYEWLGDVVIGFVGRFGLQALDAFLIALGSIVMLAVYYFASLRSRNSKAGFVSAGLLCSLAFASFNLRPQMFGYLFLVFILIVLEHFRQGRQRAIWLLPPLFLIWVNTHGSWIIGMGVLFLTLVCGLFEFRFGSIEARRWSKRQRIQLELACLFSLAMIPITPYGPQLAAYPFTVASSLPMNVANVLEWQPMPFNIAGGKLFLGLLAASFILQLLFRFAWRLDELLLALGGTMMACLHVRFLLLFVPFFAPLFAVMLARWLRPYNRNVDKFLINAALMAGVIFAMVWYFPSRLRLEQAVEKRFPVGAVNYLRNHGIRGPLYNTYGAGGYLIWALPQQKVFIDGRGDLYELGGAFNDYLQVASLKPAAFHVLDAYRIQTCLLQRLEPLATVLTQNAGWRQVYTDSTSVIFVRRNSRDVSTDDGDSLPDSRREHGPSAD